MPYDERGEESGKFIGSLSDYEFLEAIEALFKQSNTQEVVDEAGFAYDTADQK